MKDRCQKRYSVVDENAELKVVNEKRLIDANALLDKIRKSKDGHNHADREILMNHHMEHDVFMDLVDIAPTVDAVEVVHGCWQRESVPIANMDIVRYRDTCSICGAKAEFLWRDSHYNYCPNCGAKMDGGNGDG